MPGVSGSGSLPQPESSPFQGHWSYWLSLSSRWTISTREPDRLARVCYTGRRGQMLQMAAESGPKIMPSPGHALPLSWILLLPLSTSHEGWECRIKTEQKDKWHCRSGRYRTFIPASFLESNCCSFMSQITPVGSKSLIPSVFSESWASRSPKEGKHKLSCSSLHQFGSAQTNLQNKGNLSLAALLSINLQNNFSGMITQSKWKTESWILHCCRTSLFQAARSLVQMQNGKWTAS